MEPIVIAARCVESLAVSRVRFASESLFVTVVES